MGRNSGFRRDLHERSQQYLLAVPCDTLIRDLDAGPPAYQGRGTRPKTPFQRVNKWRDSLPEQAWTRIHVRDGDKGPLEVEVAVCRVRTKINQHIMTYEETLVVVRSLDEGGVTKYDFYLSRTLLAKCRRRNLLASLWPPIASKRPSSVARKKRGCRTMKFATGVAGITIRLSRSSPHGF